MKTPDVVLQQACGNINDWIDDLIDSLSQAQIDGLRDWLAALDIDRQIAWQNTHIDDISDFLILTPARRRSNKKLQALQPMLTWAAIQRLFDARLTLRTLAMTALFDPFHTPLSLAVEAGRSLDLLAAELASDKPLAEPDPNEMDTVTGMWPWAEPNPFVNRKNNQIKEN